MNRRSIAIAPPALALMGLAGCGLSDHATIRPISDFGRQTQAIYETVFWCTLGIFVVVELLLIFALWRYRRRDDDPEVPDQVHGHTWLEIGWTLAPALILLIIAIPTMRTIFRQQVPPPSDALQVTAVGHQWWWEFVYPDFGFTTANELHVPRGRTVNLTLVSGDVIHAFWVPRLGGKRDLNPGSENTIVFTADTVGVYDGQCAEFCGISHANMRMRLFVDEPPEFEAWASIQARPARPDSAGYQSFLASGCAACHAIDGTPAQGKVGPDLTHFGSRSTFAAGLFPNERDRLAAWLRNPDSLKPGALMPDLNLSEERVSSLLRLLEGLR
jgi:cytochrome c oxidase subunit 2